MAGKVNHPSHYNSNPSGVECITVVEHMSFNRGSAMKYLWRAGSKGSRNKKLKEIDDLEKCLWYIKREIKLLKK